MSKIEGLEELREKTFRTTWKERTYSPSDLMNELNAGNCTSFMYGVGKLFVKFDNLPDDVTMVIEPKARHLVDVMTTALGMDVGRWIPFGTASIEIRVRSTGTASLSFTVWEATESKKAKPRRATLCVKALAVGGQDPFIYFETTLHRDDDREVRFGGVADEAADEALLEADERNSK